MDCFVTSFLAMTGLGDSPGGGAFLMIPCRTGLSDLRFLDTLSRKHFSRKYFSRKYFSRKRERGESSNRLR
jgi:hypothetical protein